MRVMAIVTNKALSLSEEMEARECASIDASDAGDWESESLGETDEGSVRRRESEIPRVPRRQIGRGRRERASTCGGHPPSPTAPSC